MSRDPKRNDICHKTKTVASEMCFDYLWDVICHKTKTVASEMCFDETLYLHKTGSFSRRKTCWSQIWNLCSAKGIYFFGDLTLTIAKLASCPGFLAMFHEKLSKWVNKRLPAYELSHFIWPYLIIFEWN